MLQRIQSVWLLLASACAFFSLKTTFYIGTNQDLIPSYELRGTENFITTLLTMAIGLLAFICIFLYKNRMLQVNLCVVGIFLTLGLLGLYFYYIQSYNGGTIGIAALLQGAILLFFILALRGINRDNMIIKESNRLR